MARKKKNHDITEQLRKAVKESGETVYRVAKNSGVDYSVLLRFMAKERGVSLMTAAKLAEGLGLELRPKGKR